MREAADEVDLNDFINSKVRKNITGNMGEVLSKGGRIPEPKDLRNFWRSAEAAITSLNKNVKLHLLSRAGCRNVGQVILGEAAYEVVQGESFSCWREFK